ncbi:uncharacterized protein [Diadema antillarum]|uniref:uncharacterized protein n=1 Tax=Diadema antillarum TaxID=105358 RepID=UPI003A86FBC7
MATGGCFRGSLSRRTVSPGIIFFVLLVSCTTSTSTLANCVPDPSLGIAERTSGSPTVVSGKIQQVDGQAYSFRVVEVLKGDQSLLKKKIKIVRPSVTTRPRQQQQTTPPPSQQSDTVTMETAPSVCLAGAKKRMKYIVFLVRSGKSRRKYEMVYDGIKYSRKALRSVRDAVNREERTTTVPTYPSTTSNQDALMPVVKFLAMADVETNDAAVTSIYGTNPADDAMTTNTTQFVSKTSSSHLEECPETHNLHYCLNGGTCQWVSGIQKPSCLCPQGHEGERCELKILIGTSTGKLFGDYWEVFVIGTIFGIVVLLSLIVAVIYILRKKKEREASQRRYQEAVDEYIQSNYPVSELEHETDANQNLSSARYTRLPVTKADTFTDECELQYGLTVSVKNNMDSSKPFKLKDPPFRKGSNHSAHSTSKESEV